MKHWLIRASLSLAIASVSIGLTSPATAQVAPDVAAKVYEEASPSLVVVQFTWTSEIRKLELSAAGVVVTEDGVVMASLAAFNPQFPDEQLVDFKIIIPQQGKDNEEVEAEFLGRDERYGVAYVKAKTKRDWKPMKFEAAEVGIGEPVVSVGMLPKAGGYKSYLTTAVVGAKIPEAVPQVLAMGSLGPIQSPVFNGKGAAVGLVSASPGQTPYLSTGQRELDERSQLLALTNPPRFYVPASDFIAGLSDLPKAGEPLKLSYLGVREMKGLAKDVAEYYGLVDQPAIQLGDIVPGTPAAEAGLKRGAIITQLNGKPLERGSDPDDLPAIFGRTLLRMKVGEEVTLSVLPAKDQPTQDVKVTLGERPMRANLAKRYYAEDLGFGVRELVFDDIYERRLAEGEKGVAMTIVRPQSAAESARLQGNEMITQLNGKPVTDLQQFTTDYETFRKASPKEAVVLVVKREGREDTVRIEPPQ
ncbi:MAG TPA: PDZ domain-containing protein [Tepidisphaeraceae bacterium]|jgi:serine protease Do|nr:PDZ domain-containing protein [Tepidisphaeraceae bacterium]